MLDVRLFQCDGKWVRLFQCDGKWIVDASNVTRAGCSQSFIEFDCLEQAKKKIVELLDMLADDAIG